jgi:type III restriction enzyme
MVWNWTPLLQVPTTTLAAKLPDDSPNKRSPAKTNALGTCFINWNIKISRQLSLNQIALRQAKPQGHPSYLKWSFLSRPICSNPPSLLSWRDFRGSREPGDGRNIDRLFDAAGRKLATGEGLHRSYWKHYHDHDKPNQAKLELFAVVRQSNALSAMEKLAVDEFSALWTKSKSAIQELAAAEKARFQALLQASGKPVQHEWELPERIVEKKDGESWVKHLFCNTEGEFWVKLNGWEKALLREAMEEEGFIGWLRNIPRREWALCIPYELGVTKAFYPDLIVIRKKGNSLEVDVVEPHDDSRADTWAKAKGLAEFADQHGVEFGRLIVARKRGDAFEKADMNDRNTRKKARAMQSQSDLESLF